MSFPPRQAATLVLGMGNPILSDDSVGVRLARDVHQALGGRTDVDVVEECSVGGLNLLDYLVGYERVVVLDAIHTEVGNPGQIYRFSATNIRNIRQTAHLCNIHDTNFATALELGRRLGSNLPRDEDIHIFAVEVLDDKTFGTELTLPVARAYPTCLKLVLEGVLSILESASSSDAEESNGTNHRTERPAIGTNPTLDAQ